jgi:hypothetical protein
MVQIWLSNKWNFEHPKERLNKKCEMWPVESPGQVPNQRYDGAVQPDIQPGFLEQMLNLLLNLHQ